MNAKSAEPLTDKEAARLAYYDLLNNASRLATYAASKRPQEYKHSQLQNQIREHAINDLLRVGLSMRRLGEISGLKTFLKQHTIKHVAPFSSPTQWDFYPTHKVTSCWDLVGNIIHHREFQLFDDDASVKLLIDRKRMDPYEIYKLLSVSRPVKPVCYLKSDKQDARWFHLDDFVNVADQLLDEAESKLADSGVYVGFLAS